MRSILIFAILFVFVDRASALSYSTPERQTVDAIAYCIEKFHEKTGKLPDEWSQLDGFIDSPLDQYFSYTSPTKRYALISDRFSLSPPLNGEILAITRRPTYEVTLSTGFFGYNRDLKGPGRYIIYKDTSEDRFRASWVTEDYVEHAFESAKKALPVADKEPDPLWISKTRKEIYIRRGIYGLLGLGFILLIVRLSKWTPKKTEQDAAANP